MVTSVSNTGWARKPYQEILDIGESAGSVAVIPIGSIEQHGHHLPVATDTILVEAIAELGAERADDVPVLVTPSIWTGNSPHHLEFGGTISVGVHNLLNILEQVADTVLENGFDSVLLLNGHGGNSSTVSDATSIIGSSHPDCTVLGLTYFQLAEAFIHEVRESDTGGMAHAGEFETSLMLHLFPDLVDEEAMEGTYLDEYYQQGSEDLLENGPLAVYRSFKEYSRSGAIGDPHLATAEKGERIYRSLGDELESLLLEIHDESI